MAIDLRNVQFRWRPKMPLVLELPQLEVRRGERLFIKGASGSGKSTLLSLIGGVMLPQAGELRVLGQQLDRLSAGERDAFRARHIGFIFQMFNLLPYLSVIDNVLLPCHFSANRRESVRSKGATLHDEAVRLLEHLDLSASLMQRPVTELSVGQQQRVAAARALIGNPELVIADEPTSALDADRRAGFLKLLLNECAAQQATLVFVSHDAALEKMFDRSVHLDEINRAATAQPQEA
ncbi:MAG: ABC transporter ATP-binding protein [Gammaproteobacteria bacterium]|nr:ABC transporter ATP-binding protein [Gammaproteobacteria bacterium]